MIAEQDFNLSDKQPIQIKEFIDEMTLKLGAQMKSQN
jgi:hypothetical protein